jgi:hypothetical protein
VTDIVLGVLVVVAVSLLVAACIPLLVRHLQRLCTKPAPAKAGEGRL